MKNVRQPKKFFRPAVLAVAGLLAVAATLSAADAPTDSTAAPPPPPPPPPPAGTWYVFSPPKEGVVLPPSMREKLLTVMKSFLDRANPTQFAHVKDAANPFFPKLPPAPEPVVTAPGVPAAPAGPAAVPQISSAEKLQQVADQLKPSGALISGQNRLIFIASGDTLALGQSIQVTFPGDSGPTVVVLQAVSSDSYSLKLDNTAKTFPYVAKEDVPHPLPSTPPPQPKKP